MSQLPEIGLDGIDLIRTSHVTIVGIGGLGCPVILYLAAMGVGHLHLIDGDTIDQSNLSRQILFEPNDIGRLKTEAAKEYLLKYHPQIKVTVTERFLDLDLALAEFPKTDVIVDASDNFKTNYLISDVGKYLNKTVVYGAVTGWSGHAAVFGGPNQGCLRCIYEAPINPTIGNCSEQGVISAITGLVGTFQAGEVIKVLLFNGHQQLQRGEIWTIDETSLLHESAARPVNQEKSFLQNPRPTPFLHVFDMLHSSFLNVRWKQRPKCFCHSPHLELQRNLIFNHGCQFKKDAAIDFAKFERSKKPIILDVREFYENEFRSEDILGIPLSVLDHTEINLPRNVLIEVICATGNRAKLAVEVLKKAGFLNVVAYPGDIESFFTHRGSPNREPNKKESYHVSD